MSDDDIRRAVLAAVASVAPEADTGALRPDRPLREQVDLDSMDWLNLQVRIEERLGAALPESDAAASVDAIVAMVAAQAAAGGPAVAPTAAAAVSIPMTEAHRIRGMPVTVRPMRDDDRDREAAFVRGLSAEHRYQRFMVAVSELPPAKLDALTHVDQYRDAALVATVDADGAEQFVGVARYGVDATGRSCEFAVTVADAWQGCGLAGVLMHALMDTARRRGLAKMEGIVLATNLRMLKFARQLGFALRHEPGDRETVRIERPL